MREFGYMGRAPERFGSAAIAAVMSPTPERYADLRTIWKTLTEEERTIFRLADFPMRRSEKGIKQFAKEIADAYADQRRREMTPVIPARLRNRVRLRRR